MVKKNANQPKNREKVEKLDLILNLQKNSKDNKYINYSNTDKKKTNLTNTRNNNKNGIFDSRQSKKNISINQSLDYSQNTSFVKKKVGYTSSKLPSQTIYKRKEEICLAQKKKEELDKDLNRKGVIFNEIPFAIKTKNCVNSNVNKDDKVINNLKPKYNPKVKNCTKYQINNDSDLILSTLCNKESKTVKHLNNDNIYTVLKNLYGSKFEHSN